MGIFMFLLMFVLAPIVGLISTFGFGIEPWPVGVVVALLGAGGLLRIAYAVMFESRNPASLPGPRATNELNSSAGFATSALPPQRHATAAEYTSPGPSSWLEPETREPLSVIDNTTKLLEKDSDRDL